MLTLTPVTHPALAISLVVATACVSTTLAFSLPLFYKPFHTNAADTPTFYICSSHIMPVPVPVPVALLKVWKVEDGSSNKREILKLNFPEAITPYFL